MLNIYNVYHDSQSTLRTKKTFKFIIENSPKRKQNQVHFNTTKTKYSLIIIIQFSYVISSYLNVKEVT